MILAQELHDDPLGLGYAQWLPDAPGQVVALLNAQNYSMAKSLLLSERGVLERYADGPVAADAVLGKLETFAQSGHALSGVVKRALKFLAMADGIDVGSPATYAMLDQVQLAGGLTADEVTKLKALALQPASRAEVLGLTVTEADVVNAWQP